VIGRESEWELAGFLEPLDIWIRQESPSEAVRWAVMTWIQTRYGDPFRDAKRVPDLPNLWQARIPASRHDDGLIVVCSYWIDVKTHTVTCDLFGTLPEDTLE
jgi:hypothetical protein